MSTLKKIIGLLLIFTSSQLNAYQQKQEKPFFFAEALLWKLKAGSADNWAQIISPAGATRNAKLLGVPFRWDPGLRIGVVQNLGCDNWETRFVYTGFHTKANQHATATTGGIYSPFLGNFFVNNIDGRGFGPNYRHASMYWKLRFNIVDLEVGKTYIIDPRLEVRPFIGLKGGSINHRIASYWQTPTVSTVFTAATEDLKNNFWGIGPVIGLDTHWSFYSTSEDTFNLVGNVAGSVLHGHWRFKDIYRNNALTSVAVKSKSIVGAATMAKGFLGLEWVRCVSDLQMGVRIGYEAQMWFNQLQYYSFNMGRLNHLMSVQGGVLGFDLYF